MSTIVIITGSNGYIGNFLTKHLTENNYSVVGIDLDSHSRQRSYKNFVFERCDVRDREQVMNVFSKHQPRHVLHCAYLMKPQHSRKYEHDVDVIGSLNVFDAALSTKSVKQFINFSSTSIYGGFPDNPLSIAEDHPLRPREWFYAQNKKEVENYIFSKKRKGFKAVNLRLCTVVGSSYFKRGGVIKAIAKGRIGVLLDGKDSVVQFVHEEDVKNIIGKVMKDSTIEGTFNLCPPSSAAVSMLNPKKVYIKFPKSVFKLIISALWNLRFSDVSPTSVDLIAYGIIASPEKIQKKLKYSFMYSTEEAYRKAAHDRCLD